MEREQLEKIKERIAKLLAMAKDASSPNEAAIAAQRARSLMDKYQLDDFDIGEAKAQVFASEPATRAFAAVPYHVDILAVAVARYNDCHSVFEWATMDYKMQSKANQNAKTGSGPTKKVGKRIRFHGYETDVQLAKQMLDRLLENIDALCKKYMQENHPGKYNVRIGGDYKYAAAKALIVKFEQMMEERKQLTSAAGTALVVVKMHHVNEHFGEVGYKTKAGKSISAGQDGDWSAGAAARAAGHRDGQKIEITKRMDD